MKKTMTLRGLRQLIKEAIMGTRCPKCGGPGGIPGFIPGSVYPCPACDAPASQKKKITAPRAKMPEYMDELLRSVIMDVALGDISPHQGARRITKTHTDIDRYLRSMPTPQAVYDVFRGVTGLDHEDPDIIDAIDKITETWKLLH